MIFLTPVKRKTDNQKNNEKHKKFRQNIFFMDESLKKCILGKMSVKHPVQFHIKKLYKKYFLAMKNNKFEFLINHIYYYCVCKYTLYMSEFKYIHMKYRRGLSKLNAE